MTKNQQIIEALFFVSTVPLEQKDINKVFGKENSPVLDDEVKHLKSFL